MKKIFLILIFFSISFFSHSQTYIKGNATYALFAIPSFGVEVGIGEKITFQLDFWNEPIRYPKSTNHKNIPEIDRKTVELHAAQFLA